MRYLVAIPVYNEEKYIRSVLDCVRHFADDILVVNDGSRDRSGEMARSAGAVVIDHPTNYGYGRALRTRFRACGRERLRHSHYHGRRQAAPAALHPRRFSGPSPTATS